MNVTLATLSVQSCLSLLGWVGLEIEGGDRMSKGAWSFTAGPSYCGGSPPRRWDHGRSSPGRGSTRLLVPDGGVGALGF